MSPQEKESLNIALGVLRSNTDHADFLNWWLQSYGRAVLSPNPPAPLYDCSNEAEPVVEETFLWTN